MRLLFLIVSAFVLPLSAAKADSHSKKGHLTPEVIYDIEFAQDVQVSPDGKQVLYVRRSSDNPTDRRVANIWVVNTDGTGHSQLTRGLHLDIAPRWSPDGKSIAFFSSRSGSLQLHLLDIATMEVAQLTQSSERIHAFTWAPDGRRIGLLMDVHGDPLVIGAAPSAPAGAERAEPTEYFDQLGWQYEGTGLESFGKSQVHVLTIADKSIRQLTSGDREWGRYGHAYHNYTIAWSDPEKILTVSRSRSDEEFRVKNSDIFEISVADGSLKQITDRIGPDDTPIASPDGRYIAYTGYDEEGLTVHMTRLHVYDRQTGATRILAADLDRDLSSLTWRADSKAIFAEYEDRGVGMVGEFGLDGSMRRVAQGIGSAGYDLSGGYYSVREGIIAATLTSSDMVGDIFAGPVGGKLERLTDLNADAFAGITLGKVEELTWTSPAEGWEIQGWLTYPPHFDPAKRYPLILQIHGGPHLNAGPRFDIERHLYAAAGNLVLHVNPRGSTSYGLKFSLGIDGDFPGKDYDDLMSGIDKVISMGFVDGSGLYVTGGSAGGLMTQWITTRTNRFAAAASHYPVTNWTSMATASDLAAYVRSNWFNGSLWEAPQDYLRRSPLFYADKVTTPTLIMTGGNDLRTPFSESEQWFGALRLHGVDAVLARIPGEGHSDEQNWRPSHAIQKVTGTLGWFERYRRGQDGVVRNVGKDAP